MTTWQDIGTEGRPVRVLVCGGRDYRDVSMVYAKLDRLREDATGRMLIIEGGALGADRLARQWAMDRGVEYQTFPADWERYGRSAGPLRNEEMLLVGNPDLVVAFPGGSGTADMVKRANRAGVKVVEVLPSTPSKEGE